MLPPPKLPLPVLKDALKKVPSLKYALAAAVVLWILALVVFWKLPLPVAIFGSIGMFVLMVLLLLFAKVTALPSRKFSIPALVTVWSLVPIPPLVVGTLYLCIFFGWPRDLGHWLGEKPVAQESHEPPMITYTGTRLNEKQKTSLDTLGVVLQEPDDVFNAKGHDYENRPIENWICRFESVDPKPKSPDQGRKFTVDLNDKFKAVCVLKPGVTGDELEHLNHGDELTIAKAWSRSVSRGHVPDEKNDTISTKGLFLLLDCELKMPL
jgi:hypothetical protein